MLSREEIIALLRKNYSYLAAEYGVKRIGLFGSYAEGHPGEESDIDLVVEFERSIGFRFIELAEFLEHLLGRNVDLLTPAGIRGIRKPGVAADIEKSILYV
ncbi:nucleotidyltransferase family protein [Desulfosoma sp.]